MSTHNQAMRAPDIAVKQLVRLGCFMTTAEIAALGGDVAALVRRHRLAPDHREAILRKTPAAKRRRRRGAA